MHYILRPKMTLPRDLKRIPFFFFAGPVRGGGDWQAQAFRKLQPLFTTFCAAIPIPADFTRLEKLAYDASHPLAQHFVGSDTGQFERQLNWERHYIEHAAIQTSSRRSGCLIFWLQKEDPTNPRPDGHYGRDTLEELGEWRGRLICDFTGSHAVVIGGEPGFPGLNVIQRNFQLALGSEFHMHSTLDKTIAAAVALVKTQL